MHDAGLDERVRPRRLPLHQPLRKPREPVTADDENVTHTSVGKFRTDVGPERGALGVLHPDAQDMLDAVHIDTHGDMRCFRPRVPAVADLHPDRVEVDDG